MNDMLRIVCGTDFSSVSAGAVEQAARLARLLGAELHLVHAFSLPVAALPEGGVMAGPGHVAQVSDKASAEMHATMGHLTDLDVVPHVVMGPAAHEVLRIAHELGARYIVVGTHGRSGLRHLLMGSVAQQVVRNAEVPVVTVRTPDP